MAVLSANSTPEVTEEEQEPDEDASEKAHDDQEEDEGTSTPSTPPPRLPYGQSPAKEKRKRMEELAEGRARKTRRRN